ncbi:conserved Plasmodium protein, unknown function [Plasmodium sp. gorilla clade G1]|nr:conserved Plasmodium protein, unknown function [Plasmodium sp. gorilla clade G1]
MSCCTRNSVRVENPKKPIYEKLNSKKTDLNKSEEDLGEITTVTLLNGSIYKGTLKDNKLHGKGIVNFNDGSSYEGEFKNGKKEGKGKWSDGNGNSYEGEWLDDKRHGNGIYKTKDGFIFDGSFKENKRHGKATITTPDETKYICNFENDQEIGDVEFFFANGDHAYGSIKDGTLDNYGRYEFSNGDIYVGNFKNGLFHGKGYYKWNYGEDYKVYEGNYFKGKRNGTGQIIHSDGRIFFGAFKDDNMDGEILEISPQGIQTKLLYENGKYIRILDKIDEIYNIKEIIQESSINTSIFTDPYIYKQMYEIEKKKKGKIRINLKK